MKQEILVSIIVPVYNCEKYLEELLLSICNQTEKRIEIIIVNDGSTDDSQLICEKYSKKHKFIRLFNNKNHGVSYSRNFGVEKARGKYLCFVDGDDIISEKFIENLLLGFNENVQMSICAIKKFTQEFNEKQFYCSKTNVIRNNLVDILFGKYGGFLANKMYITKIIKENNLVLNEKIHISEDLLFNLEYIKYCSEIYIDSNEMYFYRIHLNSSYNNMKNIKWFSAIDTYTLILEKTGNDNYLKEIALYNLYMILIEAKYRSKKYFDNDIHIKTKIDKTWKKYITYYNLISKKNKIKLYIFKLFPNIVMAYRRRKVGD